MSAVAGALGVRLEKVGYHVLGDTFVEPQPFHISRAAGVVGFSSFLVIAGIFLIGKVAIIFY